MNSLRNIFILCLALEIFACANAKSDRQPTEDTNPVVYENDLFSVEIPKGWICDSSGWNGLDAQKNEVDIYDPKGNYVRFHFVKTFFPIEWKDMAEAKEFAIEVRMNSGDNVDLIGEIDSIDVGGYPACILYFANYIDKDTLIQKQFVTYQQDSHIVSYFNEVFPIHYWDEAQKIGDHVIRTIKLKKVKNPLEDKKSVEKAIEDGKKNQAVEEEYMERARKLVEEIEKRNKAK